jgi:ribosomal protein L20A (L18A)
MPDQNPLWVAAQDVSNFLVTLRRESEKKDVVPFGMQRTRKRDQASRFKKMSRQGKEREIARIGNKEAIELMLAHQGSQEKVKDRRVEAFRG